MIELRLSLGIYGGVNYGGVKIACAAGAFIWSELYRTPVAIVF